MTRAAVLFDTYSLVFRAFHALPAMCTSSGFPTSALYGFCSVVLKVLREEKPSALSFAKDAPVRTFRKERYADYKAGRQKAPSELVLQLDRLDELLEAFGVPVHCAPGFEADDVLATLAVRLAADGASSLVVSGDRDMLQVVSERTRVLFVGRRGKDAVVYDAATVEARFGVPPVKLPALMALTGDASVSERLRENLRAVADRLLLNEELARLRDDVPLDDGPLTSPLTREALGHLREAFEELEFKSLLPRLDKLAPPG